MNQETRNRRNIKFFYKDQSGVFAILAAILMPLLLVFLAIVIDAGHLLILKHQIQDAADATALSAAGQFYPPGATSPNWTNAEAAARTAIGNNKADGVALTADNLTNVSSGYWNIPQNPAGLQSQAITPDPDDDHPAIQLTVEKSVNNFFGSFLGKNNSTVSVTAVAVGSYETTFTSTNKTLRVGKKTYDDALNSSQANPITITISSRNKISSNSIIQLSSRYFTTSSDCSYDWYHNWRHVCRGQRGTSSIPFNVTDVNTSTICNQFFGRYNWCFKQTQISGYKNSSGGSGGGSGSSGTNPLPSQLVF